jgi:hypothetical protein
LDIVSRPRSAQEDVLERTAPNQRARGRDARRVQFSQGVVTLVDVEQDAVRQDFDSLREGRESVV